MKQGTGKTRAALEIAKSTNATLVLFLVPNSLKHNILSEINMWGLDVPFIIETYEGISQSDRRYLELLEKLNNHTVMVIADESVFIKNGKAKRYERILNIRDKSEYRLILNGTPITKNEWDIYYQMKFLSDKIIHMTETEFLNTFFKRIEYKKKNQRPHEFYKLSEVNIDYLKKLIEPYVFEVDLELDIKEKMHLELVYSSNETDHIYDRLAKRFDKALEEHIGIVEILTEMQYIMFTDDKRCIKIAENLKNQQIVYCSYIKEIEYISSNCECYVITGDTPTDERNLIIKRFKEDDKPLLMTYGVGAYGHNLQFCNKITFASITYDFGKIDQAKYRIKRLGQKRDIEYTYITSNLPVYQLIFENLIKKQSLHTLIIKNLEAFKNGKSLHRKKCARSSN